MNERRLPARRFERRPICLALIGALIFVPHACHVAHALERGMLEFVRELYARETERHNARAPISEEAFLALFARDMRGLMQAPRSYTDREPAGPILNAFFGWGVLPGRAVELIQVIPADGAPGNLDLVQVGIRVNAERRRILVRSAREDGRWKIADILYENGDSLRAYYARITGR